MLTLRRRLASWALALLFCQAVAVFAAPLSSCCAPKQAAAEDQDCCPAGSHPPGQCPRHAAARSKASCRMQCDAPHGAQFLIAASGVMPTPAALSFVLTTGRSIAIAPASAIARASVPPSPPPRLS